jgi:tRNA threonylcarbamoyladenosine biosynthesis protein TsaE
MEITSHSLKETADFAEEVKKEIEDSDVRVLFLVGDLGSGKTAFTKELLKSFGVKEKVISPTFILQKEYVLEKKRFSVERIFHSDVYRFEKPEEVFVLGFDDILQNKKNLIIIEWGNMIEKIINPDAILYAESIDENTKKYIWKKNTKKRE